MENKLSKVAQIGKVLEQAGKGVAKETLNVLKQQGKNVWKGVSKDTLKQVFNFLPNVLGDVFENVIKNKRMYSFLIKTPTSELEKKIGKESFQALEQVIERSLKSSTTNKQTLAVIEKVISSEGSALKAFQKLNTEAGIKEVIEQTVNVTDDVAKELGGESFIKNMAMTVEKGIVESAKTDANLSTFIKTIQSQTAKTIGKGLGYGITGSTLYTIVADIYDGIKQNNMILSEKLQNLEKELSVMIKPGNFFENKQSSEFIVKVKKSINDLSKERKILSNIEVKLAIEDNDSNKITENILINKNEVFGSLKRISLIIDFIPTYIDEYISYIASGDYSGTLGLTQLLGKSRDSAEIIKKHIDNIKQDISVYEKTIGDKIINLHNYKKKESKNDNSNFPEEMEEILKENKFAKVNDFTTKKTLIIFSEVVSFLYKK